MSFRDRHLGERRLHGRMLARGVRIALLGGGSISRASALLAGEDQGLAVDFTDLSIRIKDTTTPSNNFSGNVNNKLTYSGPSTKWIRGANGLYQSGTTLRTEYSAAGVALGVRIESARTNACLQSNDWAQSVYVKTNVTAALTATGPNGEANYASTLTATAANAFARQRITAASAARISSCFIKRRTGSGAVGLSQGETTGSTLVTNGDFATNDLTGWTNSSTGTGTAVATTGAAVLTQADVSNEGIIDQQLTTVAGTVYVVQFDVVESGNSLLRVAPTQGAFTFLNEVIPGVGTGYRYTFVATGTTTWIRFKTSGAIAADVTIDNISVFAVVETSLSLTSDWQQLSTGSATITNPVLGIRLATSGDAVDVVWAQCEVGAFASSPIVTAGSTVTRAADAITLATSLFPFSESVGTIVFNGALIGAATADSYFWSIADGTTNESISGIFNSDEYRLIVADGGVSQCILGSSTNPSLVVGTFFKSAAAYAASDFAVSQNGEAVGTDVAGTLPTGQTTLRFRVAGNGAGSLDAMWLKQYMYLPRNATDPQLQAFSTP